MKVTILGIDIAKTIFHLIGLDARGHEVLNKKVSRSHLTKTIHNLPPCRIAMESCGSANYWGREFEKMGHAVVLIPPQYVTPFVRTNKNDWNDAHAIAEASLRPSIPTVPIKTEEAQDLQSLHRARQLVIEFRTATINHLRGILAEYGIILKVSAAKVEDELNRLVNDSDDTRISPFLKETLRSMVTELVGLNEKREDFDLRIAQFAKTNPVCQRLLTVPGVGVLTATVLMAVVGDPFRFKNGRQFAAYIGLVPRQHSSGGKNVLLGISKRGDTYLRTLLIHGGRAVVRSVQNLASGGQELRGRNAWIADLVLRCGKNRAAVAVANKNARILWALLTKDEAVYDPSGRSTKKAA
ncbi:MAG: IS110 family transposase [Nitrospiraceae bacterium]|nr:IS110 family transposase [Nitrospiraceae bacterium]